MIDSVTNKRWILVAVSLFGLSLVFGMVAPSGIRNLISGDIAYLAEVADLHPPFSFGTFIFILSKNVLALLASFILSPFFCLAPVVALVANGWLIGFVLTVAAEKKSLFFALAGFLPHGILEIPAFILGEAAALSFGVMMLTVLMRKERKDRVLFYLKQNLSYLGVAFALLVPAAVIETYITPLFLR